MSKRIFKYSLYGYPIGCCEQQIHDDELSLWFKKLKNEFTEFCKELTEKIKFRDTSHEIQYQQLCYSFQILRCALQDLIENKYRLTSDDIDDMRDKIDCFNAQLQQIKELIKEEMYCSRLQKFILQLQSIVLKITNSFFAKDLKYSRKTSNFLHLSPVMYECTEEGPAMHATPRYILPDRPNISLFFTKQIANEINKIEQRHIITVA